MGEHVSLTNLVRVNRHRSLGILEDERHWVHVVDLVTIGRIAQADIPLEEPKKRLRQNRRRIIF